ncbi:MAG: DUF1266 domain-containing protein [Planctomycetota bacterium]
MNSLPAYAWVMLGVCAVIVLAAYAHPESRKALKAAAAAKKPATWFPRTGKNLLSPQQVRSMATGGVLCQMNGMPVDDIDTGFDASSEIQALQHWWGIGNHEDAVDRLDWLIAEGHRVAFEKLKHVIGDASPKEARARIEAAFADLDERAFFLDCHKNLLSGIATMHKKGYLDSGEDAIRGIGGWDFGRVAYVARMSHAVGYIDEETAWYYMDRATDLAQEAADSWKEHALAFLIGRIFWNGFSDTMPAMIQIADAHLKREDSPWLEHSWSATH